MKLTLVKIRIIVSNKVIICSIWGVRSDIYAYDMRPPQALNRCLIKFIDIKTTLPRALSCLKKILFVSYAFPLADQSKISGGF